MTWAEHHRASERLASEAEAALRAGDQQRARLLYAEAAEAEDTGLAALDRAKARTLGVSAVSSVSLWYKAARYERAEAAAYTWLGSGNLPQFAVAQLRALLETIWTESAREQAGVQFAPGQVIVSVKGGEVIRGGAPLDLIVEKVQTVQSLFYRTAEFLKGLPHRRRGAPSQEIQATCRPWLFQTVPGSYQFAVAVQEWPQPDLFKKEEPKPADIADQFLKILRATVEAPNEALPDIVPDEDYRSTFLNLTRNLAPTGKTFEQIEIRSAEEATPITLVPAVRSSIRQAIQRARRAKTEVTDFREDTLHGVLRAVHLDEDWLEVTVGKEHIKIVEAGEAIDDVIGPMVNRPVIVEIVIDHRNRRLFRDIEPEE